MNSFEPYMQALLWTCKSCGFVYEGGQPKMECPSCAAYKTSFIDFPQHLEREIRTAFPDVPPNHRDCRAKRLELMAAHRVDASNRYGGRVLPAESGNNINPSDDL